MKIAITGAQSTGKSTLFDALQKDDEVVSQFLFFGSPTRYLESQGNKINQSGDDSTQLFITAEHIKKFGAAEGNNVVLDRCALDGYVYTSYLYKHNRVSLPTLLIAESVFLNLAWRYDAICYIPPEIDIISDGVRSIDVSFRDEIVELFEEYISNYKLPVARITGTVEERVQKIKIIINNLNEGKKKEDKLINTMNGMLDLQIDKLKKELQ